MAFVVAALGTAGNRDLVGALLAREGHPAVLFDTGAAAVAEAAAGAPDLVIVETGLPDLTAAQVCEAMRSQPATAGIPIVVCGPRGVDGGRGVPADGRILRSSLRPADLRSAVTAAMAGTGQAAETPAPPDRELAVRDCTPVVSSARHARPHAGTATGAAWRHPEPARADDDAVTTVLLVEDDPSIAEPLIEGLGRYGVLVDWVTTGAAALSAPYPAMVLLDLGLPDLDGLEVCRRLRRTGDVPVIMLTARGDVCDRVVGLELGADDYLAKPFSVRELVARIRAVRRRTAPGLAVPA